jgi:hypothetical protein
MPRRAVVRTMLTTAIGLGALVAAAPAAQADDPCCQVSLDGVPGQLTSGGPAGGFTTTFANNGTQAISSLQLTFAFSGGDQLRGNNIDFERQGATGNWQRLSVGRHNGTLSVTDNRFRFGQPLGPGSHTTFQYRIAFVNNAPSVNVAMGVVVSGRMGDVFGRGDNQQLAQAGPVQIVVTGAAPPPTPTPTPKPTHTATATPTPTVTDTAQALPTDTTSVEAIPSENALPTSGSGDGTSGLMWLLYTVGALLLLAGIGVIGTMLWKRGPQIVETEWQDDGAQVDPYQSPAYGATTYGSATTYGPGGVPYDDPGPGAGGRHGIGTTRQMPSPEQMPPTQHMPRI